MSDLDNLLDLKRKIDEAVEEKTRIDGKIQHLKDEMKERFGISSLGKAEKKLDEMEEELTKERELFKKEVEELEFLYHGEGGE